VLLHIRHRTAYRYEEPVNYTAQILRLTPRRENHQRAITWSIHAPGRRTEQVDAHGNVTHMLTLETIHREVELIVTGVVEVNDDGESMQHEGSLSPLAYVAPTALTTADDAIIDLASKPLSRPGSFHDRVYRLATTVCETVRYRPGATSVEDSAAAALERGQGVCQDQAHVFIASCRASGIPARYVSGYLYVGESESAASHAWADVWSEEDKAWIGIDITHLKPIGLNHCRLAVGRDYMDAAPVRGVRRGGGYEVMDVNVTVTRVTDQ